MAEPGARASAWHWLALAAAGAASTAGLWVLVNGVSAGRRLDAHAGDALRDLAPASLDEVLNGITSLADTLPYAVGAVALVALAWLRGGPRLSVVAGLILLIGNGVTQLAQPALTGARHIDFSDTDLTEVGSWPSGHATAAMFLALVAILVAGPRLRMVTAVAAIGYALCVGGALVALGGHVPGDVLAGYLVAATFTSLGAAAWALLDRRRPSPARRALPPSLAPALGTLAALAVFATALGKALVTRRDEVAHALNHIPLLLALAAAGVLAVAVTAGMALVRR